MFYNVNDLSLVNSESIFDDEFLDQHVLFSFPEISDALQENEVDEIVNYSKTQELKDGLTKGNHYSPGIRQSKITWIELGDNAKSEKLRQITDKVIDLGKQINNSIYNFDIPYTSRFQYSEYSDKGFFTWHNDEEFVYFHKTKCLQEKYLYDGVLQRKLTMVIGMSDKDEYEGGNLEVLALKSHNVPLSRNRFKLGKGEAVIFPSFYPHKVTPLQSGVRKSLAVWFYGPPWR